MNRNSCSATWAKKLLFVVSIAAWHAGTLWGELDIRFYGDYLSQFPDQAIPGTAVASLFDDPSYPDTPTAVVLHPQLPNVELTDGFVSSGKLEWPQRGPSGFREQNSGGDNYGGAVSGLLYPQLSGTYHFHIRSDDASHLYFNPNGVVALDYEDPEVQPVATETFCCDAFSHGEAKSIAYELEAGQAYFLEMIWKDGQLGDWMQVGWSPDQGPIEVIPAPLLQRDVRYGAPNAAGITGGGLSLTESTVEENQPFCCLSVSFDHQEAATVQWEVDRNDGDGWQALEDPTNNFYGMTSPALGARESSSTWAQWRFRARVNNEIGPELQIPVIPDIAPPQVLGAFSEGTPNGGRILVVFDEPVQMGSATDVTHYQVNNQTPVSATMIDPRRVALDVGVFDLVPSSIQITGVLDRSVTPNAIAPTQIPVQPSPPGVTFSLFEDAPGLIDWPSVSSVTSSYRSLQGDDRYPIDPSHIVELNRDGFYVDRTEHLLGIDIDHFAGYSSGAIIVPRAGDYTFALRSDDKSLFY